MNWLDKLIMFFACLAEVFMLYDYFKNFFDIKVNKKYIKISCIGAVCMLFAVNLMQNSIVNLICIPILFISMPRAATKSRLIQARAE